MQAGPGIRHKCVAGLLRMLYFSRYDRHDNNLYSQSVMIGLSFLVLRC